MTTKVLQGLLNLMFQDLSQSPAIRDQGEISGGDKLSSTSLLRMVLPLSESWSKNIDMSGKGVIIFTDIAILVKALL